MLKRKTWLLYSLSLVVLFLPSLLFAVEVKKEEVAEKISEQEPAEDRAELRRLLAIVEKHTEIATKTKLNADFVPGMVTVLLGDDLEARGVRTLYEALNLVPGMELYLARHGFWNTMVRGAAEVFATGNMKILLDGVPLITAFGIEPTPNMPVEQVDRIEVIRGPGSALYGEFAYAGVINITTRHKGNRLFGSLGSHDTYGGGGIVSWDDSGKDLKLSLNFAGWETDGGDVEAGPDTLYSRGQAAISNAPGPTNEKMDYGSGFFRLDYKDFSLHGQLVKNRQGDFFGMAYALPPPEDQIVHRTTQWGLAASQGLDISSNLHAKLSLGWQEQEYEASDSYLYPPGFSLSLPGGPTLTYPDGWIYGLHYEERMFHGGVDLTWKGWDRHTVLMNYSFAGTKQEDMWLKANFQAWTTIPIPVPTMERFPVPEGKSRAIHNVTLQDEFRMNDQLTFTAGLRYDHYDDVGEEFSPRLAVVYRLTRHHIVKAQYARAFRPPTFLEMYAFDNPFESGNPDLEPETNDTYEIGYIYKGIHSVFRATLFHSVLRDVIVVDKTLHNNSGEGRLTGVELELERQIGNCVKLDANLSYVHTKDRDSNEQDGGLAAEWLANAGIIYQPLNNLTLALQYRYVGERDREEQDPRNDLDDYHTVDVTGTLCNLSLKGLTLKAGVKNLFNEDVRYPALLDPYDISGNPSLTYPEDLPRPGRRYWMGLTCEF